MYKIEKTDYGYFIVFTGYITRDEIKEWLREAELHLSTEMRLFGVVVDITLIKNIPIESKAFLQEGQHLFQRRGMQRSAVIANNRVTVQQFKKIAKESGIFDGERYLSEETHPKTMQAAIDWAARGIDPDKNAAV